MKRRGKSEKGRRREKRGERRNKRGSRGGRREVKEEKIRNRIRNTGRE